MATPQADLTVQDEGTIFILTPLTDAGREWINDNLGTDETQMWAGGIVVEHRYINDIVEGAIADGLEVQ